MAKLTDGDKWIKLLRAYGPVPDDMATEAEQVDGLANRLGLSRFSFQHLAYVQVPYVDMENEVPQVVQLLRSIYGLPSSEELPFV